MTKRSGAWARLIKGLVVVAAGLIVALGVVLAVAYYAAPVTRPMATI